MDFLKEILGEELFSQFTEKVNAYNGDEANKEKQIKIANLGSGEYVGKGKYDALNDLLTGKQTELDTANNLIADLKKNTKGNEELQGKITGYESQVAELQRQLAETEQGYALDVYLMDAGAKDKEAREFLAFKYRKMLSEQGKTLELDDNKHIVNGEDILSSLKTSSPTLFNSGDSGRKVLGDNRLPKGDNRPVTVSREDFSKMGYNDRLKLKQENEQLFKQLTSNN